MPQFPTYSLPQVRREPLPGVRFSPATPSGAFGENLAEGIGYLGRLGAQNAIEMRRVDDENAAFVAYGKASSQMNEYLYGANGQPGLLARQGLSALGATGEAKRAFAEIGRQNAAELQTDGARFRFGQSWLQKSVTAEHTVSNFEASQRAVASNQVVAFSHANALRDVSSSPDKDTVFDAKSDVLRTYRANGRSDIEIAEVFSEIDETAAQNQIRTIIRNDALLAAQLLLDPEGPYTDRPVEWREMMADNALNAFDRQARLAVAEEERARKVADQEEKKRQRQAAEELDALLAKNQLSTKTILDRQKDLSKEDFRYYLGHLSGSGGLASTDPGTYSDLYDRAREGESIYDDARAAYRSGELTRSDFDSLVARSEKFDLMPQGYRYAFKRLEGIMGDDATLLSFGSRSRKYNAHSEAIAFWKAHPDASDTEIEKAFNRIIQKYSIVNPDEQSVSMQLPRFLVGSRRDDFATLKGPNGQIAKTRAATDQALADGRLTKAEYDAEVSRLTTYLKVREREEEITKLLKEQNK